MVSTKTFISIVIAIIAGGTITALATGAFTAGSVSENSKNTVEIVGLKNEKAELERQVKKMEAELIDAQASAKKSDLALDASRLSIQQRDGRIASLESHVRSADKCLYLQKQIDQASNKIANVDPGAIFSSPKPQLQQDAERNRLESRLTLLVQQLGAANCGAVN